LIIGGIVLTRKTKIEKPLFKKFWVLLLVAFFTIGTVGCGSEEEEKSAEGLGIVSETPVNPEENKSDEPDNEEQVKEESSEEEPAENSNDVEVKETTEATEAILPEPINASLSKDLNAHFIDVGQGDSIFIEFPNGQSMLIDAGESNNGNQVVSYVKALGYNQIDYVVATHPHADHISGMTTVINNMKIGKFYMPEKEHTTKTFERMIDALTVNNVDVYKAKAGVDIIVIEGLYAKFLSPVSSYGDDLNNWSAVVKVVYKQNSFLFMGDAENKLEGQLSDVNVDVLKVGHHGSKTSSGQSFLSKVTPLHSIISVGTGNSYGHPAQSALSNLEAVGSKVYRTDLLGTIVVTSNGTDITVNKSPNSVIAEAPKPTPAPAPSPAPTPTPSPASAPAPIVEQPAIANVVYITNTGKKYHESGCRYLKDSKIEISLSDAQSQGYEPCGVCKP